MGWITMILICIGLSALLIFLVRQNSRDKEKIEKQLRDEEIIAEKRKSNPGDDIN